MPRVNVPNVGVVHFPDDMPEAEILREVERLSQEGTSTDTPSAMENIGTFGSNIVKGLRERASGLASLPGALMNDALGTLGGIAGGVVAAPFEAGPRLAGALAREPEAAQQYFDDPVQAVEDVLSAVPVVGGTLRAGRTLASKGAEAAYPLKTSTTMSPAARQAAKVAGLREGINPTSQAGFDKLQGTLTDVGGQIGQAVEGAAQRGVTGSGAPILHAAQGEIRRAERVPEVDPSMPGLLRARVREVETGPTFSSEVPDWGRMPSAVPIDKLQDFAQGLDERVKRMGGAFGEHSDSPQVRMEKDMSQAARQQLNELVPEAQPLKARYGPLKDLREQMVRNIGREENRDVLSPGRAVTGAMLAGGGPASRVLGASMMNLAQGYGAYPASRALYKAGRAIPEGTGAAKTALLEALAMLMQQRPAEPEQP